MIRDSEQRDDSWFNDRVFDLCIVGSGPAGITIARRVAAKFGGRIAIFEAGGLGLAPDSQDLYTGTTSGEPYYDLDTVRLRYFGGSSNHWGGRARRLDERDFVSRPQNPLSGWPIVKADLDPYVDEAASILDLTPPDPSPPDIFGGPVPDFEKTSLRFSPPTRFGQKYQAELQASQAIDVFLNANLVDLRLEGSGGAVSEAVFQSYARPDPFTVKAKLFAVCLGGLENPRALLNARSQVAGGVGNETGNVGRFFMEHMHVPLGSFALARGIGNMATYTPTSDFMARAGINNFGIFLTPDAPAPAEAAAACVDLAAIVAADLRGEKIDCPGQTGNAMIVAEQSLNPESRLKLTDARDRFGLRKADLDWHLTAVDFHTVFTAVMTFAITTATTNAGRLKLLPWLTEPPPAVATLDELGGGSHHLGTTRMSADPAHGVVDKDCRVHSTDNLYIGGSSVFATGGHANPTFTIVQLALRIGDHLAGRLRAL